MNRQALINARLEHLSLELGFDSVDAMLETATFDSVAPGICMDCGQGIETEMEPDAESWTCSECDECAVDSCLIIAGLI